MADRSISLDDKYALDTTRAYMSGIEALVRLPMLQHQRDLERGLNTAGFISGYRGSPLGSLDQALWKAQPYLDRHNIRFQPGINEDLAATAVWGSQQVNLFAGARYDGVFGMWYGKGPGVDRSMDVIRHANAFGTSPYGGVLAVAGDDHAAKSSSLPNQSEHLFIGASIPVLCPANVQEVLDLGIYGWELSRYCGCWVALKAITETMDSAISAEIDPRRVSIQLPDNVSLPEDGVHGRLDDNPLAQELRLNKYKIYAARAFALANNLNRITLDSPKARLGIITSGKAYLDVMQALEDLGIDADKAAAIGLRVFKVGMSWPLEPVSTHQFAEGLEEILVVEEKRSIIEDQLTGQLYNWPVDRRPRVVGEFDEQGRDLLPNLGELTPAMVARALAARMRRFYQDETHEKRLAFYARKEQLLASVAQRIERKPHYCSGCPHSSSTRTPSGSIALGGIGCHYMGTWEKGDRKASTFTQMGGEGVTWVGQAAFTDTRHVFQNLGDGTYFHSGLLAIRQAVSAGVNITYKILYNDAVAMTGGQALDGNISVEQMVWQLRAEGIARIAVVSDQPQKYPASLRRLDGLSVDHRERLMTVQRELRELPGTTILIYEQTCAAEKRRRRKKGLLEDPDKRVFIHSALCEGCGDCSVQSNCLSVLPLETELGRKRQIDQSACNRDFSCVQGFCPSLVTVEGGELRKNSFAAQAEPLPALTTPPIADHQQQPWNIVVTGVGGTGVLTVAALIAMAAHIEGKGCATMNQTGLAQKFGAVVSHVRVAASQPAINAVRIAAGDADLLLGCDLVVAAGDDALAKLNRERSHAVVNEYRAVTADFISDADFRFPADSMKTLIANEVGADKTHFVDATAIASNLFGDSIASNLFLLGFACQQGLLPVGLEALQQAIALNGVEVAFNQRAFHWGRYAAADPAAVARLARLDKAFSRLEDLQEIVADRKRRLLEYQDQAWAADYEARLQSLFELAELSGLDQGQALRKAAARNLYKLMAVKDEFEVARQLSSPGFKAELDARFSGDYRLTFHLAPAFLAAPNAGGERPRKSAFPQAVLPLLALLARCRFLRRTRLNPFALQRERRAERDLLRDYCELLTIIARELKPGNYSSAVQLVSLADEVKGFGPVKQQAIARYYERRDILLAQFRTQRIPVVSIYKPAPDKPGLRSA